MTTPGPPSLDGILGWCNTLAEGLDELLPRLHRLAIDIARSWQDDRGQEWAERVGNLRRELGRDAAGAAELGRAIARLADAGSAPEARRFGPRLGSTDGTRADDERGMRIPQLAGSGDEPS